MRLALHLRHLLVASWPVDQGHVARALPPTLEPVEIDGRSLVSVVTFRCRGGRAGRLPVVPYAQLNVRTYALWRGEPAVFFLRSRVTAGGVPGALLGAPVRAAWIRVGEGRVDAPGLGLSLAYARAGAGEPGELGRHELGIFEVDGTLRALRIRRAAVSWERAEPVREPQADPLLAFGFRPLGPPELFYAAEASLETELPPARLSS